MDTQKGRCHVCGGAMFHGKVYIDSMRLSELEWLSDDKITYNKKSLLTGDEKEVNRYLSFKLLSLNPFSSCDDRAEGWYCPRCEKVFASFDVKKRDK